MSVGARPLRELAIDVAAASHVRVVDDSLAAIELVGASLRVRVCRRTGQLLNVNFKVSIDLCFLLFFKINLLSFKGS